MTDFTPRWLSQSSEICSCGEAEEEGVGAESVWNQLIWTSFLSKHICRCFFLLQHRKKIKTKPAPVSWQTSVKHLLRSEGCDRSTVPTNSPEMTFCLAFSFQTFIQASRNSAGYSLGSILIWLEQKNHVRVVIHKPWKWSYLEAKSRLDVSDSPAGDVESVSDVGNWIIHAVLLQSSLTSLWSHLSKALDFSLGPWLFVTKT